MNCKQTLNVVSLAIVVLQALPHSMNMTTPAAAR